METEAISHLYQQYLDAWNHRDARAMATLTDENCIMIGFDGSQILGSADVESTISQIFNNHQTAAYIAIVKEVKFLSADVAVLRSVAGMVPPGKTDINPEVNAIQILTAIRKNGKWLIAVFQNTPAAFHGRPELSQQLTDELTAELRRELGRVKVV